MPRPLPVATVTLAVISIEWDLVTANADDVAPTTDTVTATASRRTHPLEMQLEWAMKSLPDD
jgi:hypothetical protein